jgi:lysophospholipase L1-like esterase
VKKRVLALAALVVLPLFTAAGPASAGEPACAPAGTASASAAAVKVWLAGDSTMADPRTSCPVGWGNRFDPLFNGDVTVVNSAVAGRSIQTWLYESNVQSTKDAAGECVVSPRTFHQRWLTMLDPAAGMKAGDYLMIQFGINDGSRDCPRHVGSARYKELLGLMAKAAKDRGVTPIFLTPVSAIRCSGSTAVATRGFLTETADAGRAAGATVIDLHRLSYTLYNTLKLCPNDGDYTKGPVGAFFCNDHTHFEAAGAGQIAGVVAKALRDQRIPLANHLK